MEFFALLGFLVVKKCLSGSSHSNQNGNDGNRLVNQSHNERVIKQKGLVILRQALDNC